MEDEGGQWWANTNYLGFLDQFSKLFTTLNLFSNGN